LKLVEKVYTEQGINNLLITKEELNKIAHDKQLNLEEFNQRNLQLLENKQQKAKELGEVQKAKEMQECTFKPQTYSQKQQRNFD
jgi:hypothetical protein